MKTPLKKSAVLHQASPLIWKRGNGMLSLIGDARGLIKQLWPSLKQTLGTTYLTSDYTTLIFFFLPPFRFLWRVVFACPLAQLSDASAASEHSGVHTPAVICDSRSDVPTGQYCILWRSWVIGINISPLSKQSSRMNSLQHREDRGWCSRLTGALF